MPAPLTAKQVAERVEALFDALVIVRTARIAMQKIPGQWDFERELQLIEAKIQAERRSVRREEAGE